MLWEHNSTIVVMLTKLKEMGREKCFQYWPHERSVRYQYYVVDPIAEYNMPQYKLREFKVNFRVIKSLFSLPMLIEFNENFENIFFIFFYKIKLKTKSTF